MTVSPAAKTGQQPYRQKHISLHKDTLNFNISAIGYINE